MSNDLQASISTNAGSTIATLGRVDSQLKQIHGTTGQLTQAHGRFQAAASESFRKANEGANEFGRTITESSHALSLMRGPLGEIAEGLKQTSTLGLKGGVAMAALAAAAAVAGVGFEALNHILERRMETLKVAMEAEDTYRDVLRKGALEDQANAKGGLASADQEKKVASIAGGSDQVNAILKSNPEISLKEARAAVIALQKIRDPQTRAGVLAAATKFEESGAGSLSEGVDLATGSSLVRGTARTDAGRAAALLREKALTGRFQGGNERELNNARARVQNDFLAQAQGRQTAADTSNQQFQETQAAGTLLIDEGAARAARSLRDPTQQPLEDIARATRETAEHLRRIAEAETGLARAWHALPGTTDSAHSQYEKFLKDHASELTTGANR